jgi:hypothetical protein
MDSDEVNSFSDTSESRQVANIIRQTYFNIMARANLPEHKNLFQLVASGDADSPVLMTKPEHVSRIEWIKYNKFTSDDDEEPNFQYVTILPLQQFLDLMHQVDTTASTVDTMTLNDHSFSFRNDIGPCYCTIIDDYYVVFDSYDEDVDTTLQSSKTLCYGQFIPTFTMEDDFIPDMDEQQFPLLLNEAKSLAFYELKQQGHEMAMQESRRQWRTMQRTKDLVKPSPLDQFADFGRKSYAMGPDRRFRQRTP